MAYIEISLSGRERQVKEQPLYRPWNPWGELTEEAQRFLKRLLEAGMEEEVRECVGAAHYERTPERRAYRKGYYERGLMTSLGHISLRVPRLRGEGYRGTLLQAYQRRHASFDRAVLECFLAGESTRNAGRVKGLARECGMSPQTVSRIPSQVDSAARAYHSRRLEDKYAAIILGGLWVKVKRSCTCKMVLLMALGITPKGKQEVVGFRLARGESSGEWERFICDLHRRGLEGDALRVVVHDQCGAIEGAIRLVWPQVGSQLCVFHKLASAREQVRRQCNKKAFVRDAAEIWRQGSAEKAVSVLECVVARWREVEPAAVRALLRGLPDTLAFYDLPERMWPLVRTTGRLERFHRELRRRTRPLGAFANPRSCERIIYSSVAVYNQNPEVLLNSLFCP